MPSPTGDSLDDNLRDLVLNPREGISVELKRWLDLGARSHQAKIIRACAAIHNVNGGYLLIGFNDDGLPHTEGIPSDLESEYERETIQQIVANNTSPPLEVTVSHLRVEGIVCAVIKIPAGVITPTCVKEFRDESNVIVLPPHEVYTRTLGSNGKYSSARPRAHDWSNLMRACMGNREADIAGFLSRNFSPDRIAAFISQSKVFGFMGDPPPAPAEQDSRENVDQVDLVFDEQGSDDPELIFAKSRAVPESYIGNRLPGSPAIHACLDSGVRHYRESLPVNREPLTPHGTWEVAAVINGNVLDLVPTSEFLNRVVSANPRYTYVPMWTSNLKGDRYSGYPYVMNQGYQSLIYAPPVALSFWRAETRGFLYILRALEDDMSRAPVRQEPMTTLEFVIATLRVTESILVAISIAKALPMAQSPKSVEFLFRWTGLSGRQLGNWNNVAYVLPNGLVARQNVVTSHIAVPIDATQNAIGDFVHNATRPLFAVFDGFTMEPKAVFDIVTMLIERRF
jgi:hypothetical protein